MLAAFGTMSALSLQPLMCYTHPNGFLVSSGDVFGHMKTHCHRMICYFCWLWQIPGLQSLLQHPGVLCGGEEHGVMLGAGLVCLGWSGLILQNKSCIFKKKTWQLSKFHAAVGQNPLNAVEHY